MKAAKIFFQDQIFTAQLASHDDQIKSPAETILNSPVRTLIEGVYTDHADQSRYILREPIWLNYQPSQFEKALIKVGAKRFRVDESPYKPLIGSSVFDFKAEKSKIENEPSLPKLNSKTFEDLLLSFKLLSQNSGVVAAYLSAEFEVLALAQNKNKIIKTRHAEMNLIEKLRSLKPKSGDCIMVSLQSCRMCAAALREWMGDAKMSVLYLNPEPNLKNVKTALYGTEKLLGGTIKAYSAHSGNYDERSS